MSPVNYEKPRRSQKSVVNWSTQNGKERLSKTQENHHDFGMNQLPSVSTTIFKQLLNSFDNNNISCGQELDRFSLAKELANIQGRLPAHQFYNFVESVVRKSGQNNFGFSGHLHCTPKQLINLGLRNSTPDLESLMQSVARCYSNHTDLARFSIWKDPEEGAFWFYMRLHPLIRPEIRWPLLGVHLTMLIQTIRYAEGQKWLPKQIIVPVEANMLNYQPEWFNQCSILSSKNVTAIRVDANSMKKPAHDLLETENEKDRSCDSTYWPEYNQYQTGVIGTVESTLKTFLRATQSTPSYHLMAEMSGMSERTLSRKLQAEGLNYRSLVRNIRIDLSKEYLSNFKEKVETVANLIGYPRCSSFVRCFQQVTGMSPTEYRLSLKRIRHQ